MGSLRDALLGGWELSEFYSRGLARLDAGEAKLGPRHEPRGLARLDAGEAKLGPRHEPRDVATGAVSHPLGTAPRGLILYTADGYMSAQLTGGADAVLPGYIAYGGRFHVDEDTATVCHDVSVSILPELLAAPQLRHAQVDGDRLTLSATTTNDGVRSLSTLVWVRRR